MTTEPSLPLLKNSFLVPPDPAALIGARIGHYELVQQIGAGLTGAVFRAEHVKLGTLKAVKVLMSPYCSIERAVSRFENEALALARLNHRNIVKVDDVGQLPGGERYILMPFVEGISLEAFLQEWKGAVPIHLTLHILGQVCAALDTAHSGRIVHRDLKPTNILLTQTSDDPWHVSLIDFGVAKLCNYFAATPTGEGDVFGTPSYMAAEHIEDASSVDYRIDIFALGVIAYRMVTGGAFPFGPSKQAVELYRKQRADRPHRPDGVPRGWADQILAALALLPAHRPSSAGSFALALAAATPAAPPKYPDGRAILAAAARELLASGSGPVLMHSNEATSGSGAQESPCWPPLATETTTPYAVAGAEGLDVDAVPIPILDPEASTLVLKKQSRP